MKAEKLVPKLKIVLEILDQSLPKYEFFKDPKNAIEQIHTGWWGNEDGVGTTTEGNDIYDSLICVFSDFKICISQFKNNTRYDGDNIQVWGTRRSDVEPDFDLVDNTLDALVNALKTAMPDSKFKQVRYRPTIISSPDDLND